MQLSNSAVRYDLEFDVMEERLHTPGPVQDDDFTFLDEEKEESPAKEESEKESTTENVLKIYQDRYDALMEELYRHESEKGSPHPFASAKHFLRHFEMVLSSANVPVDKHWEQWLECAIELEQLPWFKQPLAKKNLTWKEAQHRITMAYDQMEPNLFTGLGLLKLRMNHNETVQDFRLRFQKSLNDAGWTDNYQTAQVCINALPQRLKE
ncbi:hypothetical protein, partial, partial [Absidia glauca]